MQIAQINADQQKEQPRIARMSTNRSLNHPIRFFALIRGLLP
jgi:hypothetical protein